MWQRRLRFATRVMMVALALAAVPRAKAGDEAQAPAGETPTPAQEDRAVERLNKWINAPGANDPSVADEKEEAGELPGDADEESDVDRFEGFE